MKKVFITMAAVLMGMTAANAQLTVGGQFGLGGHAGNVTKVSGVKDHKDPSEFNLTIAPKVGYMLMDGKMEVGAKLDLGYNSATTYQLIKKNDKFYKDIRTSSMNIAVVPYARYFFLQKGIFNLGIQGSLSLGGNVEIAAKAFAIDSVRTQQAANTTNTAAKNSIALRKPSTFIWSLNAVPVMMFNLTDKCYMDITLDAIGFYMGGQLHSEMSQNPKSTGVDYSIKTTTSSFDGGLCLLSNYQDYVKIGFAYKF